MAATAAIDAAVPVDAVVDAAADVTAASKRAFPELLDPTNQWTYEVVEGKGLTKLRPVKGAPHVLGTLDPPKARGPYTLAYFVTKPEGGRVSMDLASTAKQAIPILFVEDGIRHLAAVTKVSYRKDNIRGFSFPNTLEGPTTIEGRPDFGTATIHVKPVELTFGGKKYTVWLAEATLVERSANETFYEVNGYAPGVGPVLVCSGSVKDLLCLRWVGPA